MLSLIYKKVSFLLKGVCGPLIFLLMANGNLIFAHGGDTPAPAEARGQIKFTENKGQWDDGILYRLRFNTGALFLEQDRLTYNFFDGERLAALLGHDHSQAAVQPDDDLSISGHAFYVRFNNANLNAKTKGSDDYNFYENYFIGDDPGKWKSNVGVYNRVNYEALYPGIDMSIFGKEGELKYEFQVQAGVDPAAISMSYEGVDDIYLKNGELHYRTSVNSIHEMRPLAWQYIDGEQVMVDCEFVLEGNTSGFRFPNGYDTSHELVIDPVLIFSTYTGSTADNFGFTATYDNQGNFYAGGTVFGAGYPTVPGSYQTFFGGPSGGIDVSISKFNPSGTALIYSTYLGGGSDESPSSLVVNSSNQLIVFGVTSSSNFPTTLGAYDRIFAGGNNITYPSNGVYFTSGTDMFVTKFNAAGSGLVGSTFIGGSANDGINNTSINNLHHNYGDQFRGEVIVDDATGNIYVASSTNSSNFPTTPGALQTVLQGSQDACVVGLNANLTTLNFSTYLGGSNVDAAYSVKLHANGSLYVTGGTASNNFPGVAGSLDPTYNGGSADGFVSRMSTNGITLTRSAYFGTNLYDQSYFVEIDGNGDVYITGQTNGNYPIQNVGYFNNGGSQFIHRFNQDITASISSTRFGSGSSAVNISPTAFLVDDCFNVYVAGWGGEANNSYWNSQTGFTNGMPITSDAQQSFTDGDDFYFIVLGPNMNSLVYASYFGAFGLADHVDGGTSRFDRLGVVYQAVCAGCGGSSNFPTTPGVWSQTNNSFNCNLAAIKLRFDHQDVEVNINSFPDTMGCAPLEIQFEAPNQNAQSFYWDFGDGVTSTDSMPSHTYTQPGVYQVMLIGTDSISCDIQTFDDTTYASIIVEDTGILADFSQVLVESCDSIVATFTNASVDAISYHWSFGDGDTSILQDPQHVYFNLDTFEVQLIATNNCGYSDTAYSTIYPPSSIVIAEIAADSGCAPHTASFINNSSNATSYSWYFGNGDSSTLTSPSYTYSTPGTYQVSLVARNPNSCNFTDTAFATVLVTDGNITAAFSENYLFQSCDSLVIDFTNNSAGATNYQWDFGDGMGSASVNPQHTYLGIDTFEVQLIASNNCNADTAYSTIVQLGLVQADFTADSGCTPHTVNIVNNSIGATSYYWYFGNGDSSTLASPGYTYSTPGIYQMSLVARNPNSCNLTDTAFTTVLVTDGNITAAFSENYLLQSCDSLIIDFTNNSTGATDYQWDFGDGLSSVSVNPQHTYLGIDTFEVQLIASNSCSADTAYSTIIQLGLVQADFMADSGCAPHAVNIINNSVGATSYQWTFGDGGTATTQNPSHLYNQTGSYQISLIANNPNTCNLSDTAYAQIIVVADTIAADFSHLIIHQDCDSVSVNFTDLSYNASEFFWTFGDGSSSTLQYPYHNYTMPGTFVIQLVASNACGISDTAQATVIQLPRVGAEFEPDNGCYPYDPSLENTSENATAYQWDLGDGNTSTAEEPSLPYLLPGAYPVTLVATNPNTCNQSSQHTDTVYIYTPAQAAFTTDTSGFFIFTPVDFYNQSQNAGTYSWTFGDGGVSSEQNPSYAYSDTLSFTPCLTAISVNGCEDTYCKDIKIDFRGLIDIPDAFSPNGDGANDEFFPRAYGVSTLRFRVYNRWGELVFESSSIDDGWDGTYKGAPQEMDVYVYTLEAVFIDGNRTDVIKGNVTLLR